MDFIYPEQITKNTIVNGDLVFHENNVISFDLSTCKYKYINASKLIHSFMLNFTDEAPAREGCNGYIFNNAILGRIRLEKVGGDPRFEIERPYKSMQFLNCVAKKEVELEKYFLNRFGYTFPVIANGGTGQRITNVQLANVPLIKLPFYEKFNLFLEDDVYITNDHRLFITLNENNRVSSQGYQDGVAINTQFQFPVYEYRYPKLFYFGKDTLTDSDPRRATISSHTFQFLQNSAQAHTINFKHATPKKVSFVFISNEEDDLMPWKCMSRDNFSTRQYKNKNTNLYDQNIPCFFSEGSGMPDCRFGRFSANLPYSVNQDFRHRLLWTILPEKWKIESKKHRFKKDFKVMLVDGVDHNHALHSFYIADRMKNELGIDIMKNIEDTTSMHRYGFALLTYHMFFDIISGDHDDFDITLSRPIQQNVAQNIIVGVAGNQILKNYGDPSKDVINCISLQDFDLQLS
jgi:hypothetical protein